METNLVETGKPYRPSSRKNRELLQITVALMMTMNTFFLMERKTIHNPQNQGRFLLHNQSSEQLRSVVSRNGPPIAMLLMPSAVELSLKYTLGPTTIPPVYLLLNHPLLRSSSTTQSAAM
jgi:hypothetical protein